MKIQKIKAETLQNKANDYNQPKRELLSKKDTAGGV